MMNSMSNNTLFTVYICVVVPIFLLFIKKRWSRKNLPPGSLGFPIIGQSLSLMRAMKANATEEWFQKRIRKYGPISKLRIFGNATVFIYGQAANKFVFSSDGKKLCNGQNQSLRRIMGEQNLLELNGADHKRHREAIMSFLKPDSLKEYVEKLNDEVKLHIETHWKGKQEITVFHLMKTLTFNIICTLLFGIERGSRIDVLLHWFEDMIAGMISIPFNLPFTRYNLGLKASRKVEKVLKELIAEKRRALEQKLADPHQGLITCLLSFRDQISGEVMSEKEIVDNIKVVMVAGHETSSVLLTFMMRLFALQPAIYASVLQEQEEIARSKQKGESLTWEDLGNMKYTWRVALETLRMYPPVFGTFRKAVTDIEYNGYLIPKGWQVFWVAAMTHNDETIFPEPFKFDPSRFENQSAIPSYCYVAFGAGHRICPGYEFAKIETLVAIHYLVTQFTWELLADTNLTRFPYLMPTQGLPIKITPRLKV